MSIFLKCVIDSGLKNVKPFGTKEKNGTTATIYLSTGFFPRKGFVITRTASSLDGEVLDHDIEACEIEGILEQAVNK